MANDSKTGSNLVSPLDSILEEYRIKPIGLVHSCFKEKFAIPRQPALAPAAKGEIELFPPYNDPLAIEGLEDVSHLWINFIFHQAMPKDDEVRLRVRPVVVHNLHVRPDDA